MAMILDKQVLDKHVQDKQVQGKQMINHTLDVCLATKSGMKGAQSPIEKTPVSRQVETTRFGTLEVNEDLILTFGEGMIGFEDCTRYIVISQENNSPFRWLQSLDRPDLAFPILDPTSFRPDYAPTISDADARLLGLPAASFMLLCVVTVPPHNPREMTANLLGPLVVNALTRRGKQVIVLDEGLTTRHRIADEVERATTRTTETMAVTGTKAKFGRASRAA